MSAREERVARNEVLFREVNEQIDAAAERVKGAIIRVTAQAAAR